MVHPDIQSFLVDERIESLRDEARRVGRLPAAQTREDTSRIELRLCRVGDDQALERLAELEGRPLPFGRLVVAEVDGRIVAAHPIEGGRTLADPFVPTAHLLRLLELRAAQLRGPEERRGLLPRYAGLIRNAIQA